MKKYLLFNKKEERGIFMYDTTQNIDECSTYYVIKTNLKIHPNTTEIWMASWPIKDVLSCEDAFEITEEQAFIEIM